jgi:hypothetical protein
MSSSNPNFQDESSSDELDRLVRNALQSLVSNQSPPDRVWRRIKAELEKDKSSPRRFQAPWLPMVMQPALTILLAVLGVMGLRVLSNPYDIRISPSPGSSPPVATVYLDEELASLTVATFQDKVELRSLKASPACPSSRCGTRAQHTDAEPATQPTVVVPRDPIPNVLSPEGRALMAELALQRVVVVPRDPTPNVLSPEGRALIAELSSRRLAVEERQRKHSGQYQWHR